MKFWDVVIFLTGLLSVNGQSEVPAWPMQSWGYQTTTNSWGGQVAPTPDAEHRTFSQYQQTHYQSHQEQPQSAFDTFRSLIAQFSQFGNTPNQNTVPNEQTAYQQTNSVQSASPANPRVEIGHDRKIVYGGDNSIHIQFKGRSRPSSGGGRQSQYQSHSNIEYQTAGASDSGTGYQTGPNDLYQSQSQHSPAVYQTSSGGSGQQMAQYDHHKQEQNVQSQTVQNTDTAARNRAFIMQTFLQNQQEQQQQQQSQHQQQQQHYQKQQQQQQQQHYQQQQQQQQQQHYQKQQQQQQQQHYQQQQQQQQQYEQQHYKQQQQQQQQRQQHYQQQQQYQQQQYQQQQQHYQQQIQQQQQNQQQQQQQQQLQQQQVMTNAGNVAEQQTTYQSDLYNQFLPPEPNSNRGTQTDYNQPNSQFSNTRSMKHQNRYQLQKYIQPIPDAHNSKQSTRRNKPLSNIVPQTTASNKRTRELRANELFQPGQDNSISRDALLKSMASQARLFVQPKPTISSLNNNSYGNGAYKTQQESFSQQVQAPVNLRTDTYDKVANRAQVYNFQQMEITTNAGPIAHDYALENKVSFLQQAKRARNTQTGQNSVYQPQTIPQIPPTVSARETNTGQSQSNKQPSTDVKSNLWNVVSTFLKTQSLSDLKALVKSPELMSSLKQLGGKNDIANPTPTQAEPAYHQPNPQFQQEIRLAETKPELQSNVQQLWTGNTRANQEISSNYQAWTGGLDTSQAVATQQKLWTDVGGNNLVSAARSEAWTGTGHDPSLDIRAQQKLWTGNREANQALAMQNQAWSGATNLNQAVSQPHSWTDRSNSNQAVVNQAQEWTLRNEINQAHLNQPQTDILQTANVNSFSSSQRRRPSDIQSSGSVGGISIDLPSLKVAEINKPFNNGGLISRKAHFSSVSAIDLTDVKPEPQYKVDTKPKNLRSSIGTAQQALLNSPQNKEQIHSNTRQSLYDAGQEALRNEPSSNIRGYARMASITKQDFVDTSHASSVKSMDYIPPTVESSVGVPKGSKSVFPYRSGGTNLYQNNEYVQETPKASTRAPWDNLYPQKHVTKAPVMDVQNLPPWERASVQDPLPVPKIPRPPALDFNKSRGGADMGPQNNFRPAARDPGPYSEGYASNGRAPLHPSQDWSPGPVTDRPSTRSRWSPETYDTATTQPPPTLPPTTTPSTTILTTTLPPTTAGTPPSSGVSPYIAAGETPGVGMPRPMPSATTKRPKPRYSGPLRIKALKKGDPPNWDAFEFVEPIEIRYANDTHVCPSSRARWQDFTVYLETKPRLCMIQIEWNARYKRTPIYHRSLWGTDVEWTYKTVYDGVVRFIDYNDFYRHYK